jgi:hypothetical protein
MAESFIMTRHERTVRTAKPFTGTPEEAPDIRL